MKKPSIFFRADGNATIGLGHVIRSLALAEMLSPKFICNFLIKAPSPTLKKQILSICTACIELPNTKNYLDEAKYISNTYLSSNEIVVLDGYIFDTPYQRIIKKAAFKLICIDDIMNYHFVADGIINHAGGVSASRYSKEDYTQCYLGLKYALLRKPFRLAAQNRLFSGRTNNLFICLGGADPNNDIISILKKCEQFSSFNKIFLVLGGAYSHRETLNQYLKTVKINIELLSNLSAVDMAHYMKLCKAAITPPSTISFEYLSIGGILYFKKIAANQDAIESYFLKEGLAFTIDEFPIQDSKKIQKALSKQAELLNGNAQEYFTKIFTSYSNAKNLSIS